MNRVLLSVLAGIAAILIFVVVVVALIPDDFVEGVVRSQMENNVSLTFGAEGFRKKLPFGFEAEGVKIFPPGESVELVYFDRLDVSLNPLYLLIGRARLVIKGVVGDGEIRSVVTVGWRTIAVDTEARNVAVASIPVLRQAGLRGSGILAGKSAFTAISGGCPDGSINAEGAGVDLNGVSALGINLLLKDKADITLALDSSSCKATIKSFWVDGRDLKLKLYGDVFPDRVLSRSRIDLTLEVLPKDDPKVLALFSQYKKSSRFYSMRLKGDLASVAVSP
jgi:type II secretion system protein N